MYYVYEEELIKFWKSSASGSGSRNFVKDSSTLRDRAFFHNLAYISGESDQIFIKKFYHRCILGQGSPIKVRGSDTDPDHILLGGRMRSLTALVFVDIITYRACV